MAIDSPAEKVYGPNGASLEEALDDGVLVAVPRNFIVTPGRRYESSVFIALVPGTVESAGGSRKVRVGDIIAAEEVAHSGSAVQAAVNRGHWAELDADHGLAAAFIAARVRLAVCDPVAV